MLELRGISVKVGDQTIIENINLDVADGTVVAILGPSGSGKTTLLRAVAGLQPVHSGTVRWDGDDITTLAPHKRGFGLMFQDYALFPHRSIGRNVAFGLHHLDKGDAARRVSEVLDQVGLAGSEKRRLVGLSGGEQQRVALARALAPSPRLLMLDEPLGSLDRALRERLVGELGELFRDLKVTGLYVTHDQEESFALADQLVLLHQGRVVQTGAPEDVWRQPANIWAARFLGFQNVFSVARTAAGWESPLGILDPEQPTAGATHAVVHPDGFLVDDKGPLAGAVRTRSFQGGHYTLTVLLDSGIEIHMEATGNVPQVGDPINLSLRHEAIGLLNSSGGAQGSVAF